MYYVYHSYVNKVESDITINLKNLKIEKGVYNLDKTKIKIVRILFKILIFNYHYLNNCHQQI